VRLQGQDAMKGLPVVVLALGACAAAPLSGPPLEADFAGTWSGAATLALTGRNPVPYSLALNIALSGSMATGNAEGCGATYPLILTFVGTK